MRTREPGGSHVRGPADDTLARVDPIRTLLVADEGDALEGLRSLTASEEIEIVGEVTSIEDAAEVARGSWPEVMLVDLRAPIGDAIEAMRQVFAEKSVVLSAAMGPSPCTILGDHSELEQLFLNLLMNAHEVTAPGGMVHWICVAIARRRFTTS